MGTCSSETIRVIYSSPPKRTQTQPHSPTPTTTDPRLRPLYGTTHTDARIINTHHQPLQTLKNFVQDGRRLPFNPAVWYRGWTAGVLMCVPMTVM